MNFVRVFSRVSLRVALLGLFALFYYLGWVPSPAYIPSFQSGLVGPGWVWDTRDRMYVPVRGWVKLYSEPGPIIGTPG